MKTKTASGLKGVCAALPVLLLMLLAVNLVGCAGGDSSGSPAGQAGSPVSSNDDNPFGDFENGGGNGCESDADCGSGEVCADGQCLVGDEDATKNKTECSGLKKLTLRMKPSKKSIECPLSEECNISFRVSGGSGDYEWVAEGLPDGLELSEVTKQGDASEERTVAGKATRVGKGEYDVTITVLDGCDEIEPITKAFKINVTAAVEVLQSLVPQLTASEVDSCGTPIKINPNSMTVPVELGKEFSAAFDVSGGSGQYGIREIASPLVQLDKIWGAQRKLEVQISLGFSDDDPQKVEISGSIEPGEDLTPDDFKQELSQMRFIEVEDKIINCATPHKAVAVLILKVEEETVDDLSVMLDVERIWGVAQGSSMNIRFLDKDSNVLAQAYYDLGNCAYGSGSGDNSKDCEASRKVKVNDEVKGTDLTAIDKVKIFFRCAGALNVGIDGFFFETAHWQSRFNWYYGYDTYSNIYEENICDGEAGEIFEGNLTAWRLRNDV